MFNSDKRLHICPISFCHFILLNLPEVKLLRNLNFFLFPMKNEEDNHLFSWFPWWPLITFWSPGCTRIPTIIFSVFRSFQWCGSAIFKNCWPECVSDFHSSRSVLNIWHHNCQKKGRKSHSPLCQREREKKDSISLEDKSYKAHMTQLEA